MDIYEVFVFQQEKIYRLYSQSDFERIAAEHGAQGVALRLMQIISEIDLFLELNRSVFAIMGEMGRLGPRQKKLIREAQEDITAARADLVTALEESEAAGVYSLPRKRGNLAS